jgi:hypothetical protein
MRRTVLLRNKTIPRCDLATCNRDHGFHAFPGRIERHNGLAIAAPSPYLGWTIGIGSAADG